MVLFLVASQSIDSYQSSSATETTYDTSGYIYDLFPVVLVSLVIITSLYGIVAAMVFLWAKYGWHIAYATDVEQQQHPEIACYGAIERSTTYYDWNRPPPYRQKMSSPPTRYPPQVRRFYRSSVNHPRHPMSQPSPLVTMEERQNHWHKRRDALLRKFAAPTN